MKQFASWSPLPYPIKRRIFCLLLLMSLNFASLQGHLHADPSKCSGDAAICQLSSPFPLCPPFFLMVLPVAVRQHSWADLRPHCYLIRRQRSWPTPAHSMHQPDSAWLAVSLPSTLSPCLSLTAALQKPPSPLCTQAQQLQNSKQQFSTWLSHGPSIRWAIKVVGI